MVPFWLPQMETDIRKPATRKSAIDRPIHLIAAPHSNSNTNVSSNESQEFVDYTEPVSDDEEDGDDNRHQAIAKDEASWTNLPKGAADEAKAFRNSNAAAASASAGPSGTTNKKVIEIFTKLTPSNLKRLLNSKYTSSKDAGLNSHADQEGLEAADESGFSLKPGRIEYVSSFRAQPGKRIAIPVRIEPKVFFANERTSQYSLLAYFRAFTNLNR